MIGNNKATATEGSQVVRVHSGGQPHEFFNSNYLFLLVGGSSCMYSIVRTNCMF